MAIQRTGRKGQPGNRRRAMFPPSRRWRLARGSRTRRAWRFIRRRTDAGPRGTSVHRSQGRQSLTRTRASTGRSLAVASSAVTRGSSSSASRAAPRRSRAILAKTVPAPSVSPVAGNFHARTEAARPRFLFTSCPCCSKHSVWKAEESGRKHTTIRQNYITRPVYKTRGKLVR